MQLAARRLGGAQLLLEGLELLAAGRARARRVGLGRLEPPLQRRAGALRLGERPGLGRGVDLVRALDLRLERRELGLARGGRLGRVVEERAREARRRGEGGLAGGAPARERRRLDPVGLGVALAAWSGARGAARRGRPLAALGGLLLLDGRTQRRLDLVARLGVGRGGRRGVAGLGEVGARASASLALSSAAPARPSRASARRRCSAAAAVSASTSAASSSRLASAAAARVSRSPRAASAAPFRSSRALSSRSRASPACSASRSVAAAPSARAAASSSAARSASRAASAAAGVARRRLGGLEPGLGVLARGLGRNRARLGGLEARGRVRALGRGARARGRGLAAVLAEAPALGGVGGLGPGLGLGGVALGREQRRARVGRVRIAAASALPSARAMSVVWSEGAPRVGGVEARRVALGRHLAQEPLEAARLGLGARAVARARAQEGRARRAASPARAPRRAPARRAPPSAHEPHRPRPRRGPRRASTPLLISRARSARRRRDSRAAAASAPRPPSRASAAARRSSAAASLTSASFAASTAASRCASSFSRRSPRPLPTMSARSALSARSRSSRVFFRSFSSIFVTSVPKAPPLLRDARQHRPHLAQLLVAHLDLRGHVPARARRRAHLLARARDVLVRRPRERRREQARHDRVLADALEHLGDLGRLRVFFRVYAVGVDAIARTLNTKDAGQKRRGSPPRCRSRPRWAPAAPRPPWRRPRARRA